MRVHAEPGGRRPRPVAMPHVYLIGGAGLRQVLPDRLGRGMNRHLLSSGRMTPGIRCCKSRCNLCREARGHLFF